jgi:hypothetical protein
MCILTINIPVIGSPALKTRLKATNILNNMLFSIVGNSSKFKISVFICRWAIIVNKAILFKASIIKS